jgi:hypothetical protein
MIIFTPLAWSSDPQLFSCSPLGSFIKNEPYVVAIVGIEIIVLLPIPVLAQHIKFLKLWTSDKRRTPSTQNPVLDLESTSDEEPNSALYE